MKPKLYTYIHTHIHTYIHTYHTHLRQAATRRIDEAKETIARNDAPPKPSTDLKPIILTKTGNTKSENPKIMLVQPGDPKSGLAQLHKFSDSGKSTNNLFSSSKSLFEMFGDIPTPISSLGAEARNSGTVKQVRFEGP
jgi:hypothetical protein